MGIVERAAKEAGLTIERDVPIPGQRRCKDWAKLIGLARKLESSDDRAIELERARSADLVAEISALRGQVFKLKERLLKHELKDRIDEMELPPKDRKFLLGINSD